jgi:hypothetical protein
MALTHPPPFGAAFFRSKTMNSEKEVAEKLVKKALKLRKEIGEVATWCEETKSGDTTSIRLSIILPLCINPIDPPLNFYARPLR